MAPRQYLPIDNYPPSQTSKIHRIRRVSLTKFEHQRSDPLCEPHVKTPTFAAFDWTGHGAPAIRSRRIKYDPSRPHKHWWIIEPVAEALAVAERLS